MVFVLQAILKLLQDHDVSYKDDIIKAVIKELTSTSVPLSPSRRMDRHYLMEGLKLLFHLNAVDSQLDIMLMAYYIEADIELKELIYDYWVKRGLDDPLGYFVKAMGDLSLLQETEQSPGGGKGRREVVKLSLTQLCHDWMEEWAEKYLIARAPQLLKSSSPTKYVTLLDHFINHRHP